MLPPTTSPAVLLQALSQARSVASEAQMYHGTAHGTSGAAKLDMPRRWLS